MKSRRLFWNIVEKIEQLIESGLYQPGSRLPPERELAEKFDEFCEQLGLDGELTTL